MAGTEHLNGHVRLSRRVIEREPVVVVETRCAECGGTWIACSRGIIYLEGENDGTRSGKREGG
jgi:Fe-S-cluster-containing hydrogenase component 2